MKQPDVSSRKRANGVSRFWAGALRLLFVVPFPSFICTAHPRHILFHYITAVRAFSLPNFHALTLQAA